MLRGTLALVTDDRRDRPGLWTPKRLFWMVVAAAIVGLLLLVFAASGVVQTVAAGLGLRWTQNRQSQVQIVLLTLGGAIALAGVGFTASRHMLEREEGRRAAQRIALERERQADDRAKEDTRRTEAEAQVAVERERVLRDRFVTIAGLLDSSAPMTRWAAASPPPSSPRSATSAANNRARD